MPRPTLPGRRPMAPSDRRVSERGQMLVIFALAMVALIGMVGLIIDGGDTALQRRDQQNVADAAAMAAGYAYVNGLDETAAAQTGRRRQRLRRTARTTRRSRSTSVPTRSPWT